LARLGLPGAAVAEIFIGCDAGVQYLDGDELVRLMHFNSYAGR
jgi:hypothetical protein